MAKISHLVPKISEEGARHLDHSLRDMLAKISRDVDPGPRGAVIRSLGLSIAQLVEKLRHELDQVGLIEEGNTIDQDLKILSDLADLACDYWDANM